MDLRLPITSRPLGLVLATFVAAGCSAGAEGSLEAPATETLGAAESSTEASSEHLGTLFSGNFYSFALPADWEPADLSALGADDVYFQSLDGRSTLTVEYLLLADYDLTLASYLTETISIVEEKTGTEPESTEPTVLDGEPATLRIYHFPFEGVPSYVLVIAISRESSRDPGGTGTMLAWWSDAGNETRDRATFDAIRESYAEYEFEQ